MNQNLKLGIRLSAWGVAVAIAGLVISLIRPRVVSKQGSDASNAYNKRSARLSAERQNALDRGDFSAAERLTSEYIKMSPRGDTLAHKLLGDVYFEEGKSERARLEYSLFLNSPVYGDETEPFARYGQLCLEAGELTQAKLGFDKVLEYFSGQNYLPLRPPLATSLTLEQLRSVALAEDGLNYHFDHPRYLRETAAAMKSDPDLPFVRWVRADALYRCGLLSDSRKLFDQATESYPTGDRLKLNQYIDDRYEFKRWDHRSGGVIGRDGKVTFTRYKMPLPNRLNFTPASSGNSHIPVP